MTAARWSGRRVAVIGAGGFIGSHLVDHLLNRDAEVLAVVSASSRAVARGLPRSRCAVAAASIDDGPALLDALRPFRPDTVVHLAARPDGPESFGHMREGVRVNALGVATVLEAACRASAGLVIYGDSSKVFGNNGGTPDGDEPRLDPLCSYAIAKAAGWQLCTLAAKFTGINVVGLRPTLVYGPRQGWNLIAYVRRCVERNVPVRLQGGAQTRAPLHIDDAVEAYLAAGVTPEAWGESIAIGGARECTVATLAREVLAALGSDLPIVEEPHSIRATEVLRGVADNTQAYRLLNWEPRIGLQEGLRRTFAADAAEPMPPRSASADGSMEREPIHFSPDDRRSADRRERRRRWRGGRRVTDRIVPAHAEDVAASSDRLERSPVGASTSGYQDRHCEDSR